MGNNFFEGISYGEEGFKGFIPKYYPKKYQAYIKEEVQILKRKIKGSKKILEAGVGIGRLIPDLAPLVDRFVGVDNAKYMLNQSKRVSKELSNVEIISGDLEKLSSIFSFNEFDCSLCVWNTLGNVKEPLSVLSELRKVTKDKIFLTVFHKGHDKDRKKLYKNVNVKVLSVDDNETYHLEGYVSRSFSKENMEKLAKSAHLQVMNQKLLGGVILWSEMSKTFAIQSSSIHGKGVFTRKMFTKGDKIFSFPKANISKKPKPKWAHIGNSEWVGNSEFLRWLNHSCEANAKLEENGNIISIVAQRNISEGKEITVDYSITERDGKEKPCSCRSYSCKGTFPVIE